MLQAVRPLVLVVDDEEEILRTMKDLVEGTLGYPVLTAENGREALQLLATLGSTDVDLIVSDYRMAPMDGLQFLGKAKHLHPDVPRLMMTAFPDMDIAIKARNDARISSFLVKPLNPTKFLELIKEFVTTRRATVQRERALERALDLASHGPAGPALDRIA